MISETDKKSEVETKKFVFPTSHLINFSLINRLTKLYGEEYAVMKKALWYIIFSLPIRTELVDVGDVHTDCRFHVAFPLPSGGGKKNLIVVILKIAEKMKLNASVPTSLHPEQLVGKVIREKGKKQIFYDKIKGHFADDVLIIDEATELMRSRDPTYRESRKYVNVALDTFHSNKIYKKPVDIPRNEALIYFPSCNIELFLQPFIFNEEVVLIGTLRRFLIIYMPINMNNLEERFSNRIDSKGTKEEDEKIIEQLSSLLNGMGMRFSSLMMTSSPVQFYFTDDSKNRLKKLHMELVKQGLNHSKKGMNFTIMTGFSLQDTLAKMSCIQAASRLRNEVKVEDVEYAYVDLAEFLQCTLDFIEQKIYGNLDYGVSLNGFNEEDIKCLNWLVGQGALTPDDSKVSINAFIQYIMRVFTLTESGATYRYNKMKENGWIDSKKIGQYDSRVWAKFETIKTNKSNNISLGEFTMEEYSEIVNKIKP